MKINKLISVLGAASLALTLSSCEDYLTVEHNDILPSDFMFQNEDNVKTGLMGIYDTFYPDWNSVLGDDNCWGFKPQIFAAGHSAMDCQASGWDAEWQRHAWQADKGSLETLWRMSYRAVDRANRFLDGLGTADDAIFTDKQTKSVFEAEARAIRAFNYLYLTKIFGRVPMLLTGETYSTAVGKARAETVEETYSIIKEDLEFAMGVLDWKAADGETGRITKGFCKAYLADLLLLEGDYSGAKQQLKDIIDSGVYELESCYGNIHAFNNTWSKEVIWEEMFFSRDYMGWSANNTCDASMWLGYMCAAPEYGGWGSLCLSWELYNCFEPGDKRKEYSLVAKGDAHPITGEVLGTNTGFSESKFQGSENMPQVYSLKYWRCHPGRDNQVFDPISLTFKRLAGVLLDYAECCFQTGDDASGWDAIAKVRNRAFGNLEVGASTIDLPESVLNTGTVAVPDAKEYYTKYKAEKGYSSDVWKVAVIQEKRRELNAEFSLYHDLCRMGMCEEWFAAEYPHTTSNSSQEECLKNGWSLRMFEHQKYQELFPIPTNEILTNPLITDADQNPGY